MQVKSGTVMRRIAQLIVLVSVVALAGCQAIYENHGYVPTDSDLAQVKVGQTTRDQLTDLIGRPSATGVLEGAGWYYVGSRWKFYGPFAPKEVDRQVVAISFTNAGVVSNVERFGLDHGEVVTLSRRVTKTSIQSVGLVRQLLGNFGRISPSQFINN